MLDVIKEVLWHNFEKGIILYLNDLKNVVLSKKILRKGFLVFKKLFIEDDLKIKVIIGQNDEDLFWDIG